MKAILFDMDGVIADTEEAYRQALNNVVKKLGIHIEKDAWFSRFPGTGLKYIMSTVLTEKKYNITSGILTHWISLWAQEYQTFVERGEIKLIKGFLKFNRQVNEAGLKKIIVTGSNKENTKLVLQSYGIDSEFEIIGDEDIENAKPSPDGFLKAAQILGCQPSECRVVEDAVVGIQAAKAAGMKCLALTTSTSEETLAKEKPYLICNNYIDLKIEDLV